MSDEEINIKIAEYCGWQYLDTGGTPIWYHPNSTLLTMLDGTQGDGLIDPPDYCNDLNACHEMESMMRRFKVKPLSAERYNENLAAICRFGGVQNPESYRWHATARQRAEAFLKTIEE